MPITQPRKTKFLKQQKGRVKGKSLVANTLALGDIGIQALGNGRLKSAHLEMLRVLISRNLGSNGKMWFRVFPDKSVTKKPAETRMGKGKGDVDHWVAVVRRGRIIVEVGGVSIPEMREILRTALYKLPIPCRVVTRKDVEGGVV
ncbi:MAG: 50S ribosomal protein L16 [bacterium JZ-2024 1]